MYIRLRLSVYGYTLANNDVKGGLRYSSRRGCPGFSHRQIRRVEVNGPDGGSRDVRRDTRGEPPGECGVVSFGSKSKEHRGRIVNTPGDSALVEFASAVDATRCAMEIQKEMAERNAVIPEDRRIELRIGINVGDVIVDDQGDIYGDGVNIAARVESLARP